MKNKCETNKLGSNPLPLFALTDEILIAWKFSLCGVKEKSITARIQAIILLPLRKYCISLWLVLS